MTNDIAPSYVHRILHSDVESAPSAAAAELPRRPSGAVDLGNPLLNAISSAVRETLVSMVIIITRTAHSEALTVGGAGYDADIPGAAGPPGSAAPASSRPPS